MHKQAAGTATGGVGMQNKANLAVLSVVGMYKRCGGEGREKGGTDGVCCSNATALLYIRTYITESTL